MFRANCVLAILTMVLVASITSLAVAQMPVIITDGSIVDQKNPPGGIGGCWSVAGQQTVGVLVKEASQCDNLRICEPIAICSSLGQVSPKGCTFRKTYEYILVGDCTQANFNQCRECEGDGQRFCMVYKIFREKHGGTCQRACDEWQLHFDGKCTEGEPVKP